MPFASFREVYARQNAGTWMSDFNPSDHRPVGYASTPLDLDWFEQLIGR